MSLSLGSRDATTAVEDDLIARYRAVRGTTEALAAPLGAEDCQVQSMPDASPVKWHLAHTSWFFETFLLVPEVAGYTPFHASAGFLYNSYYNAIGDRVPRHRRGLMSRPTLDFVRDYRAEVDRAMLGLLAAIGDDPDAAIRPVVELGLNHEQQHQELILTDLKHAFAQNPIRPTYLDRPADALAEAAPLAWRGVAGGVRRVGHDGEGFAFDNESPRHRVFLDDFEIASRGVSVGEYLRFMADGGYSRPELWLSDGWAAAKAGGWAAPLYWERTGEGWSTMTLAGFRPVVAGEPACHVSFYEADAFARWAGARLPTEAEWEVAAEGIEPAGNFLDSGRFHPIVGDGSMFGDVWEWTRSPYTPYPGAKVADGALGEYNAKFMCNQMVLRGGSCATPASHIRPTYRNFFPPDARWQFTGIRLAKDSQP